MTRKRITLYPSEWPEIDQRLWQAANNSGGFLEPDGKAAHWRDKTRTGIAKRYGLWLGYLATTDQLNPNKSPCLRANEAALTSFVYWLQAKGNASVTVASVISNLNEALRVMEPDQDRKSIKELNITLQARRKPVRVKHTKILHPDDLLSGAQAFLEGFPKRKFLNELSRAAKYRDGLAIAFLTCRPIRLKNFTETVLGKHLIRNGARWHCQYEAHEMKDHRPLDFSFPDRLIPHLETYLDQYRPILLKGNTFPNLWISSRGAPLSEQTLYCNTCSLTEELFGHSINPHLFRDCAASALATDDPEHILAIARILGHSSITTTTRHYNQSQMTAAGEILYDVLADLRNTSNNDHHWSHEQ